jgi:branched-chain amino acid transport system permease protein
VVGSVVYISLEYFLSRLTEHWQAVMGPLIVLVVLFAGGGLVALLAGRRAAGAGPR